jgi:protein-L-isoaspartate(D-aspartate) O-methyltransferase
MDPEEERAVVRRAYARQVIAAIGMNVPTLEAALAEVRREDFLGPGPWPILQMSGEYVLTQSDDPTALYGDTLIGLIPELGLNNGQASFLSFLIAHALPRPGDHAVHVGAGVGYYSAVMATMVGPTGRVTAIEYEPALAERAAENFADWPNVRVVSGDGASADFGPADVIFVNAGATRPVDIWLDRLRDGGRLILPLTIPLHGSAGTTPSGGNGAVFRILRRGEDFDARFISPISIYPCTGARDDASEAALIAAFNKGGWRDVTRLRRQDRVAESQCWLSAPTWSLTYS